MRQFLFLAALVFTAAFNASEAHVGNLATLIHEPQANHNAPGSNVSLVHRSLRRRRKNRTNKKPRKNTKTATNSEIAAVTQFQQMFAGYTAGPTGHMQFSTIVRDSRGVTQVWFELYASGQYMGRFEATKSGADLYSATLQGFQSDVAYTWKVRSRVSRRVFTESAMQSFRIPATSPEPTPPPIQRSSQGEPTAAKYGLQDDCGILDSGAFNICLDLVSLSGKYESWMDSFIQARNRWEQVIVQDDGTPYYELQAYSHNMDVATEVPAKLDDLYISGSEREIDGVGGVIGMAAPQLLKRVIIDGVEHWQALSGFMFFDKADIQNMQRDGTWKGVIEHEMGHVLGMGTLFGRNGLHSGDTGDDKYTGRYAKEAWRGMGCSGDLPIETDFGSGTAGMHWDEGCLEGELMTGFTDSEMPLSRLTIGALKDMGYGVNMDAADPFPMSKLSSCAKYCPEAPSGRHLRPSESLEDAKKKAKKVSKKVHQKLVENAKDILKENRSNAPTNLPDDIVYVGGEMLKVYVLEDGELKEDEITWDMIKAAETR